MLGKINSLFKTKFLFLIIFITFSNLLIADEEYFGINKHIGKKLLCNHEGGDVLSYIPPISSYHFISDQKVIYSKFKYNTQILDHDEYEVQVYTKYLRIMTDIEDRIEFIDRETLVREFHETRLDYKVHTQCELFDGTIEELVKEMMLINSPILDEKRKEDEKLYEKNKI
tara:strand:- start:14 stop:523 length:510 start_codon:yes stop_codon:yes gene_type:complete